MPGFFCPCFCMACKLKNITPCRLSPPGILRIALLEHEDLQGLAFDGLALISSIQRVAEFTELVASSGAKYSVQEVAGGFLHTLETHVASMAPEVTEELWKATKKDFFVLFVNGAGETSAFGYDSPATLTYQGGTEEGAGYTVTLTCSSKYPTLGAIPSAIVWRARAKWEPDFENGAFCTY